MRYLIIYSFSIYSFNNRGILVRPLNSIYINNIYYTNMCPVSITRHRFQVINYDTLKETVKRFLDLTFTDHKSVKIFFAFHMFASRYLFLLVMIPFIYAISLASNSVKESLCLTEVND